MISEFRTAGKTYYLKTAPLCCNKFGLAELLSRRYERILLPPPRRVLDVGCGVGPLGVYFAEQFPCDVVGVEINPVACACCAENIEALNLTNRFRLARGDFRQFAANADNTAFDLIVSVPPVDTSVSSETIRHYAGEDFRVMNPRLFAYLTNSWHDENGSDLIDFIFRFGRTHLKEDGQIIIAFCLIDCKDPAYVTRKAERYRYICVNLTEEAITPESVGVSPEASHSLRAFVMCFRREEGAS